MHEIGQNGFKIKKHAGLGSRASKLFAHSTQKAGRCGHMTETEGEQCRSSPLLSHRSAAASRAGRRLRPPSPLLPRVRWEGWEGPEVESGTPNSGVGWSGSSPPPPPPTHRFLVADNFQGICSYLRGEGGGSGRVWGLFANSGVGWSGTFPPFRTTGLSLLRVPGEPCSRLSRLGGLALCGKKEPGRGDDQRDTKINRGNFKL